MAKVPKDFSELTDEELKKKLKTSKLVTGMLAVVLTFLFLMQVYLKVKGSKATNFITPIALSPILFLNIAIIRKMKAELNKRGL